MNDITATNNTDLSHLKSAYYLVNAKPDTTIKILQEGRKINIQDIYQLHHSIEEKLRNNEIFSFIPTVDLMLQKGKALSFSAWGEFENWDWKNTPEKIENISIKWDFLIQLPNYKIPQRHTVRVRIGSEIKASEYFQIMFEQGDDLEIETEKAFAICKIDFVNRILANEIIGILENWYDCLDKVIDKSWLQKLIEKYRSFISSSAQHLIPLLVLSGIYIGFHFNKLNIQNNSELFSWIILLFIIYYLGDIIGGRISSIITQLIYKLKEPNIFAITRGDEKSQKEIYNKNFTIIAKIITWIGAEVASPVIAIIIGHYLK